MQEEEHVDNSTEEAFRAAAEMQKPPDPYTKQEIAEAFREVAYALERDV